MVSGEWSGGRVVGWSGGRVVDIYEEITVAFVAVVPVPTRPRCGRSLTELRFRRGQRPAPNSCVGADSVDPTQTLAKESIEYEYEYEYEASFDVEPLRGWELVVKPRIREATGRLTPKALHNIAQGRDSAPWVGMRQPRSANPNGVLQMAGWGPEATFQGSRFRPDPSRARTTVADGGGGHTRIFRRQTEPHRPSQSYSKQRAARVQPQTHPKGRSDIIHPGGFASRGSRGCRPSLLDRSGYDSYDQRLNKTRHPPGAQVADLR